MSDIKSYDSFAKLNIMSEVNEDRSMNIPQIMIDLAQNNEKRTWNGDRLTISYTSGSKEAGLFTISEVTGSQRNKLNCELIGSNNIYQSNSTFNNSFIFSRNNSISYSANGNTFINSDNNSIQPSAAFNINLYHSNSNTITTSYKENSYASAHDISLYNSNTNRFLPYFYHIKGTDTSGREIQILTGGVIQNKTLINSNNNRFSGYNETNYTDTLINTNNNFLSNNEDTVMIGGDWNYINEVSGRTICIGRGLINEQNNNDKIILGQFNTNSTDPNEVLIVGDGRYLGDFTSGNEDWATNDNSYLNIISALSSNGSPTDSGIYRHNIFTVNKNGYITISNYENPSNSARFGYNGITAYNNNIEYKINYQELYNKLNIPDAMTTMQETIDSYTKQIEDISDSVPSTYFYTVPANIKNVYLNYTPDVTIGSDTLCLWSSISSNVTNNTLFGVTFEGDVSDILNIHWIEKHDNDYVPDIGSATSALVGNNITAQKEQIVVGLNGQTALATTNETTLNSYCTKQFMFVNVGDSTSSMSGFLPIFD